MAGLFAADLDGRLRYRAPVVPGTTIAVWTVMKMLRCMRVVLLFGVLLSSAVVVHGKDSLTIAASPAMSMAPSTVRVRIHVEPNSENRALTIVAESGDYFRSSLIQLEGENSPATVSLSYDNLPGGEYQVRCVLTDSNGRQRATAHATLTVVARY